MNPMDHMGMVWFVLVVVFLILEGLTQGLTTIWFAAGALVAMILALCNLGFGIQCVAFLVVSTLMLAFVRKKAVLKTLPKKERTNVDALVGQHGLVKREIKPLEPGEVFVYGNTWTAISKDETMIQKGTEVEILGVEGVKLLVTPCKKKEG